MDAKVKKLILHIGHGKTGSSFIQSMLALNAKNLKDEFYYPYHKSFEQASKGHISSGNGSLLFSELLDLNSHKATLFSTENFFNELIYDSKNRFQLICKKYDVKVLLYSRNILDYFYSGWVQGVKRHGYVSDFESYIASVIKGKLQPYSGTIDWLDAAESYGFNLIFRNYSNHSIDLFDIFLKDVSNNSSISENLKFPPSLTVNRSLSTSELELQRVFNVFDKQSGRYISDQLVNLLPNIIPARPSCSEATYNLITDIFTPLLNEINSRVDSTESLSIGDRQRFVMGSGEKNQADSFSMQQITVLGEALNKEFSSSLTLRQSVDDLRDIALKIESKKELSLDDALVLMKLAKAGRPNGPLISKKISEWEEKLQSTAGHSMNFVQR
jgi:hypothetical protein